MSFIKNQQDVEMKNTYDKLSRKAKLYHRYRNPARYVLILMFVSMTAISILTATVFPVGLYPEPWNSLRVFLFMIPLPVALAIQQVLLKKARPFNLHNEEWTFLDVYEALSYLSSFTEMGIEPDRQKAVKKVARAVERIDDTWTGGSIRLVQDLVDEDLREFRRNLKERIRPNVEAGSEEDLEKSCVFLMDFARYLLKPSHTIDDIKQFNAGMSAIRPLTVEKRKLIDQLIGHSKMKHFIAIIGCGIGGVFAFLFGCYYLGVAKEYAYTAALAFTGTLFIAYVSYVKRK